MFFDRKPVCFLFCDCLVDDATFYILWHTVANQLADGWYTIHIPYRPFQYFAFLQATTSHDAQSTSRIAVVGHMTWRIEMFKAKIFGQLEEGQPLNPARIMNQFTELEEQKEVAAIFNTHLQYDPSAEDRDKALTDVIKKIRLASIEEEMIHTGDIVRWQELLTQKTKIQKLNIHLS